MFSFIFGFLLILCYFVVYYLFLLIFWYCSVYFVFVDLLLSLGLVLMNSCNFSIHCLLICLFVFLLFFCWFFGWDILGKIRFAGLQKVILGKIRFAGLPTVILGKIRFAGRQEGILGKIRFGWNWNLAFCVKWIKEGYTKKKNYNNPVARGAP